MADDEHEDDDAAESKPAWKWGDEDPENVEEPAVPMLDPESAERVAEAEPYLATGRTPEDIRRLLLPEPEDEDDEPSR